MTDLGNLARDIATDAAVPESLRVPRTEGATPRRILVIVDTQIDFVMRYGLLAIAGAEAIVIPGIGVITNLDAGEYAAVLYTYDTHVASEYIGSLENVGQPDLGIPGFRLHCEKGTIGWENVFNPRLVPKGIPVFELEKKVFDAWEKDSAETPVHPTNDDRERLLGAAMGRDEFFTRLQALGVDTAVVIGVAADFCVKDQVRGLLARGFNVEVIEEVTAGIMRDMAQTIADEFAGQVTLIAAGVPDAAPLPEPAND